VRVSLADRERLDLPTWHTGAVSEEAKDPKGMRILATFCRRAAPEALEAISQTKDSKPN
jgi:hypothetical protein